MPKIDSTITISIILAICALFAPSITAIINNRHQYKIRKLELRHNEFLHQSDMTYKNKYEIYKKFIQEASNYSTFNDYSDQYIKILSCLQSVLLLCDGKTLPLILKFQAMLENYSSSDQNEYLKLITSISNSFNRELSIASRIYNN